MANVSAGVQKLIYGQRTDNITPQEINRWFQQPIDPEFNLVLYRAFERRVVSPDVALLQAIPVAISAVYLTPIAFCLRFGADPNMYVNAPGIGVIHLLGYVYTSLGQPGFGADVNVLNTIVLMLVAKGSRPSHPMFDRSAGEVRTDMETRSPSPSVLEWLRDEGYNSILEEINITDPSELQRVVDADSLVQLSIYLNDAKYAPREYIPADMISAINARSDEVMKRIPFLDVRVQTDYKTLAEAVNYLNAQAYIRLLEHGQMPSYVLVNRILVNMRHYRNRGSVVAAQELQNMLERSVALGTELDADQRNILSTLGPDVLSSVLRAYDIPYWRKVCNSTETLTGPPDRLKHLAVSLNIDPSMSEAAICNNISKLAKADKDALKEAAKRRQQMRMISDMGTMDEFLNGKTPNLTCRNASQLPHSPFEYNDVDIAWYRDDQGAIWCFSSQSFAGLLETGVNPYNQTLLPTTFLEQIQYQIDVLQTLGIAAGEGDVGIYSSHVPVTFTEAIDSLTKEDKISESTSADAVSHLTTLASQYGISPAVLRSLTRADMTAALRSIGYDIDLTGLTTPHALVTTARVISDMKEPDLNPFFASIDASVMESRPPLTMRPATRREMPSMRSEPLRSEAVSFEPLRSEAVSFEPLRNEAIQRTQTFSPDIRLSQAVPISTTRESEPIQRTQSVSFEPIQRTQTFSPDIRLSQPPPVSRPGVSFPTNVNFATNPEDIGSR